MKSNKNIYDLIEDEKMDKQSFWSNQATCLDWMQKWNQVLEWIPPYSKWFVGGKLNASYNCLDRHISNGNRNKVALFWEGEQGDERAITYEELYLTVKKFSNVLKQLGVQKGDVVAIYLPMIPEAVVAMLSCARIGAIHTVIFGGFSSESLRDRIIDSNAKVVVTADGGFRKGVLIPLKDSCDIAVGQCSCVEKVVVVSRTKHQVPMKMGRDFWYHDLMENISSECPAEEMDAEDTLFILYTSGTTGKPKGIVHTTGGYMVGATMTTRLVFDVQPSDVYWCTADVGWITGHSYVVYGPMSNGMTQVMYEGAPDCPEKDRFWRIIEKYQVTTFYTAPTAVRTFMKWGEEWLKGKNLSSLRLLGVVGEPINPEAWSWYHSHIGQKRCPVLDTWWQTETGSIMIAPIPGITELKPGSATLPLPGIDALIVNDEGIPSSSGNLTITSPWPSMLRGIHKDPERYEKTYWRKWGEKYYYFTGDGAKIDDDGYFWLMGRVDDVINVAGHRLGTMEIESALVDYPLVAEAAAIGIPHEIKGTAIVCFVVVKDNKSYTQTIESDLKQHVVGKIGAIARPDRVILIAELPKTRSGKIMRRLLRDIAEGRILGDITTLSDPSVINQIKGHYDERKEE